jgi:hypothetical protein
MTQRDLRKWDKIDRADTPPDDRGSTRSAAQSIVDMLSTPADQAAFVDRIRKGVREGSRTEVRLFAELHKLVGAEKNLAVTFAITLGAKDEHEARRAVLAYQESLALSPEQRVHDCAQFIVDAVHEDDTLRADAVRVLAPLLSRAEVK